MPIPLVVAWTLARELLRAVVFPLHLLAFLPRRRRLQQRTAAALQQDAAPAPADVLSALADRVTSQPRRTGHVLLSCGEASGEGHLLHLVDAVTAAVAATPDRAPPRFSAFGGDRLRARGVPVHFDLSSQAIFGVAGVFKALPRILRAVATFLRVLRDDRPDLVVLIDYPGLHVVFAEAAQRRGIPVLHYVAPQYWGWGPWRMRRYRRAVDVSLTILPFEPGFFAAAGIRSAYVGHPLLDELAAAGNLEAVAPGSRDPDLLVLMPGSRRKELELHLEPMLALARDLAAVHRGLRVVIPHRDPKRASRIQEVLAATDHDRLVELVEGDPAPWLRRCRAALVKSGTGSLESCLHGAPTVVVFVVDGPIARWAYHNILLVPFFGAANLFMAREIVPEVAIEWERDWQTAGQRLRTLWSDGPVRDRCVQDLAALRTRLGAPGASARAAAFVLPACPPTSPR